MNKIVIGLGKSGLAAARLLDSLGLKFYTFESKLNNIQESEINKLNHHLGTLKDSDEIKTEILNIDQAIISPGISPQSELVKYLIDNKIKICTEVDLALKYLSGSYVAITGTNGKSTLTKLVADTLKHKNYIACGNIGYAVSEVIANDNKSNLALELSSYQIEYMDFSSNPMISVFLSFATDHLERHGTLENYFKIKWKLIERTLASGRSAIIGEDVVNAAKGYGINCDDTKLIVLSDSTKYKNRAYIDNNKVVVDVNNIIKTFDIPGGINVNGDSLVCSVVIFSIIDDLTSPSLPKNLLEFRGLPYRYEKIMEKNGFKIINDSKSTNVHSTMFALMNTHPPIMLLLGGVGKKESYRDILKLSNKISTVICFGQDRSKIAKDLDELKPQTFKTLKEALFHIQDQLKYPKVNILFSPACASFDEFENFEDRGRFFNDHIP